MQMRQAVVLAGGRGERLRPLTLHTPKPMMDIRGKPFLEHLLLQLKGAGITEVLMLTGYLAEVIEEHFADGRRLGMAINYAREDKPLGTGGALLSALPLLHDHFHLVYGDSFLPLQPRRLTQKVSELRSEGAIAIYEDSAKVTGVKPNLRVDPLSQRILDYSKEGGSEFRYIDAGMLYLPKAGLKIFPANQACTLDEAVLKPLIAEGGLIGVQSACRFYDIGTPTGLDEARRSCFLP